MIAFNKHALNNPQVGNCTTHKNCICVFIRFLLDFLDYVKSMTFIFKTTKAIFLKYSSFSKAFDR